MQNPLSTIPLWPHGAPGALGHAPRDIPAITPYLPDPPKATGAAILVCPGGGYAMHAAHEGEDYARFFNAHGIAAFVLTYRLASSGYHYPAMFLDVARAMRLVRARAAEWNIDPGRIGIIGSSAGGHLISMLLTHFDAGQPSDADPIERQSSRPDIGILCYPVITTGAGAHPGTMEGLLGPNPEPGLSTYLSSELQVTPETPPCLIFHTWEDAVVPVENALLFASALRAKQVYFDLHIYERGPHGIGLGGPWDQPETHHPWTRDCVYWLKEHRFSS